MIEVLETPETENIEIETQEVLDDESFDLVIDENNSSDKSIIETDNCETEVDDSLFSSDITLNSATTQETVEYLSTELFVVVEKSNYFGTKQVKEAEQLIVEIIDFCNAQKPEEQWNTLAQITRRSSKALMVMIGYSGKEHKEWFLNLPQLLAYATLENPEELDWVNKKLRSEALLIISNSTAFS